MYYITLNFNLKLLTTLLALIMSCGSHASTVLRVDIDYMLSDAELIFEGEVIARQSHWNKNKTSIYTEVLFQIDDVVKGEHDADTLTLRFGGGTVDDMTLSIASLRYPEVGEKGIYFVESKSRFLVNPLIGWSQGHFLIKPDIDGEARVMTDANIPVMRLDPSQKSDPKIPFSEGVANGVMLGRSVGDDRRAMKKNDFKKSLKDRLTAMKNL